MRNLLRAALTSGLIALTISLCEAQAVAADPLIGTEVYFKNNAVAKVGTNVVDVFKMVAFPATVEDVNGEWLWLGRAWVRKRDVMDLPTAFDYYIDEVRRNPRSANAWYCRANCWHKKGEYTNALKDYDEAIRLDPREKVAYNGRGITKSDLNDHAGAIKDYDEAIRLDPKNGLYYNNRAVSKEIETGLSDALSDYNEAIRLDPKAALYYRNRAGVKSTLKDHDGAIRDYDEAIRLDSKSSHTYVKRGNAKRMQGDVAGSSPTSARRSNSIRKTLRPTTVAVGCIIKRRIITRRSGITPARSPCLRRTTIITPIGARRCTRPVTSSALATSTRRCD
ncbi:MAG: tetratricopeptide repeat protein [Pirellulales bacterium]